MTNYYAVGRSFLQFGGEDCRRNRKEGTEYKLGGELFPYMPGSLATNSVLLYEESTETPAPKYDRCTVHRADAFHLFRVSEVGVFLSDLSRMQHHVPRSNAHTQQISHPLLSSGNARTKPLTRTEDSMKLQSLEPKPKQTLVKRLRQGPVRPDDGMASTLCIVSYSVRRCLIPSAANCSRPKDFQVNVSTDVKLLFASNRMTPDKAHVPSTVSFGLMAAMD
jgi:hypothetical protein